MAYDFIKKKKIKTRQRKSTKRNKQTNIPNQTDLTKNSEIFNTFWQELLFQLI